MKQIYLKKLKITRFKGLADLVIDFATPYTNIYGANATGKTTLADAFLWVLFGKDSSGRKDFEIKTLDSNGNPYSRVGHEVTLVLLVDNAEMELRRIYSEKWVKQRGAETATFIGHEESFFINGVPLKKSDYNKEIDNICEEGLFKLITNPYAFQSLSWKERRDLLTEVAGDVTNEDVATEYPAYALLVEKLKKFKSEEAYKKMLQASVMKAKQEIKLIPARIDEVKKSMPESPIDFASIRRDIEAKEMEISSIDSSIEDITVLYQAELDKINSHNRKIAEIRSSIESIEIKAKAAAKGLASKDDSKVIAAKKAYTSAASGLEDLKNRALAIEADLSFSVEKYNQFNKEIDALRLNWKKVNAEQFRDEFCPVCKQKLKEEEIEKAKAEFTASKNKKLADINHHGQLLNEQRNVLVETIEKQKLLLSEIKSQIEDKTKDVEELKSYYEVALKEYEATDTPDLSEIYANLLAQDKLYNKLLEELEKLESTRPAYPNLDNTELKNKRTALRAEIDLLKKELAKEDLIKKYTERIAELEGNEQQLAQQIASVDKELYTLEEFSKTKADMIERKVRDKFSYVTFRMFREQINGALEQCCDILINGVPYQDANTASKINAGIDIINTLTKHFGISAPIFIDNRESITDVIDTESQLINLIVSPSDKKLRVEEESLKEFQTIKK